MYRLRTDANLIWPELDSFVPELALEPSSTAQGSGVTAAWTNPDWFTCLNNDAGSPITSTNPLLPGLSGQDAEPFQKTTHKTPLATGTTAADDKKHANREHQRRFRERQKVIAVSKSALHASSAWRK